MDDDGAMVDGGWSGWYHVQPVAGLPNWTPDGLFHRHFGFPIWQEGSHGRHDLIESRTWRKYTGPVAPGWRSRGEAKTALVAANAMRARQGLGPTIRVRVVSARELAALVAMWRAEDAFSGAD